ncbi:MAG TPA: valine--tRNA ligase [Candidatus Paceibacterota bacterium]|nr:valine--tRNA ligase [Candidatus Paceibacterota bacterium]
MAEGMDEKFKKPYDPQATEGRIYEAWEKSGYFNPDNLPGDRTESFTVTLPPPNVTGVLHLGHAYEDSLQDSVVRYQRMRGKKALWVPGTDSAAIATQARVEKDIQKNEGKNRHEIGREELVKRVAAFAKQSESTILNQVRRMGASLDWSRYAYTLDEPRNKAVMTAFKRMYDAGLVYRGNRIVNWDPKGQTTISDDEIAHEERAAKLYTFRYSKDFPIPVATTRLETKVGDVAVAVHPDDPRYKEFIGKTYDVTFCDVPLSIKVVGDQAANPEFGTGAVGVTPAHSMTDWDIAERNNLPKDRIVINEYAKMTAPGRVNGLKTTEARETVAEWLRAEGLMEKEEDITQNVSIAERTGGIVEPLPKLQWFVGVDKPFTLAHSEIPGIESGSTLTLKELMRKAVEAGGVSMPQDGFRSAYFHWIDNLHDWCISRQIWFGHRIPVWYKGDDVHVGEAPTGEGWEQDADVFDTWFSSQLWTFSTLGWPDETADLKTFHPTSFMSPAYEILFLWVSRMILASGFLLGEVPFKTVMIHGLVRDKQGRKFSKSLNNGIDPIEVIEKYGADALRMGLIVGTPLGADIKFDEQKVKAYKLFANKLWNVSRFIFENTAGADVNAPLTEADTARETRVTEVLADVTKDFDEYRLYLASDKLYHYVWDELADKILEDSKKIFGTHDTPSTESAEVIASRKALLLQTLDAMLRALHPFMPFVTEEIWQSMPTKDADFLMVAKWPV